jgi:hypothetical protein
VTGGLRVGAIVGDPQSGADQRILAQRAGQPVRHVDEYLYRRSAGLLVPPQEAGEPRAVFLPHGVGEHFLGGEVEVQRPFRQARVRTIRPSVALAYPCSLNRRAPAWIRLRRVRSDLACIAVHLS